MGYKFQPTRRDKSPHFNWSTLSYLFIIILHKQEHEARRENIANLVSKQIKMRINLKTRQNP